MSRTLSQLEMTFRPYVPFSDHETSREAANSVAPTVSRMEALALEAIRCASDSGLTDSELEAVTGLGPNTARPRRIGLVLKGLVKDSGKRRRLWTGRMAKVWIAT